MSKSRGTSASAMLSPVYSLVAQSESAKAVNLDAGGADKDENDSTVTPISVGPATIDGGDTAWTARRGWIVAIAFLMAAAGITFFICDFALPPVTWPYNGYNVTITTTLPYRGLQFSQWNIAIPVHFLMFVFGVMMGLLALPSIYAFMYEMSKYHGVSLYLAGIYVMFNAAYVFFYAQVANLQDLLMCLVLSVPMQIAAAGYLYNFLCDMAPRLLALRQAETKSDNVPYTKIAAAHPIPWRNYLQALNLAIWTIVIVSVYSITSLQYYQYATSSVTNSARYWIIIANLVLWAVVDIVVFALFALRAMASETGKSMRMSNVFDVLVLFTQFFLFGLIGVALFVAAVIGQPTY
jgi:hypothetical protein